MRNITRCFVGMLAAVAGYALLARPRLLRWGATAAEATAPLAGDDLVPDASYQSTLGVTIQALPEAVWPWLVQLGQGRAGFYTYDRLERLGRTEIQNVDRIVPEWQHLAVGDIVRLSPVGGPTVARLEPGRLLLLHDTMDVRTGRSVATGSSRQYSAHWTWTFVLQPAEDAATRLIVRTRASFEPRRRLAPLIPTVFEPVVFVMERGMLHGIKARAEHVLAPPAAPARRAPTAAA